MAVEKSSRLRNLIRTHRVLNLLYYKLHPSGPEFCSWGKEEELEEWTLPKDEGEPVLDSVDGENLNGNLKENIEMTPLIQGILRKTFLFII